MEHNDGKTISSNKYRPWEIIWFAWFETDELVSNFEIYLKGGSGFAFRKRHLIKDNHFKSKSSPLFHKKR
jgi:putative endonuclease